MSDIETKLGQIATVINQIDDPKVPRNIRKGAKEACEQWLLNKSKEMDIRIAITQAKLEEFLPNQASAKHNQLESFRTLLDGVEGLEPCSQRSDWRPADFVE